jgi:hypothetical protein
VLARAGPYDARVGLCHGQGPDCGHVLVVEDRLPVDARVGGLPDAPGGGARFNFTLPTTKFEPKNQNGQ